jgi:CRISPR/Cas system CMR subunit Cmr6 (Cas7 group RAMP superfamily)
MRFKTPYYGAAGQTLTPVFNGLAVHFGDKKPAGLCICHDAWPTKDKSRTFFLCGNQAGF